MTHVRSLQYYDAVKTLQACALSCSSLRPVAQRKLFNYIDITIPHALKRGNLTALLCCFSTTHLATYVRGITIRGKNWYDPGDEPVSINIPELQKVLALVAGSHEYTTANGERVRQESPVTSLHLNGLIGTEEQCHDLATMFPRLQKLELWGVHCDDTPRGDVVACSGTERITALHGALREFVCRNGDIAVAFQRLFPDNLPVHLDAIKFDLDSDDMMPPWDDLIRRAGASLHTLTVAFTGVREPTRMSPRTSMLFHVARNLTECLVIPDSRFDLKHPFEGDRSTRYVRH